MELNVKEFSKENVIGLLYFLLHYLAIQRSPREGFAFGVVPCGHESGGQSGGPWVLGRASRGRLGQACGGDGRAAASSHGGEARECRGANWCRPGRFVVVLA